LGEYEEECTPSPMPGMPHPYNSKHVYVVSVRLIEVKKSKEMKRIAHHYAGKSIPYNKGDNLFFQYNTRY
jgi:hypothetical protein